LNNNKLYNKRSLLKMLNKNKSKLIKHNKIYKLNNNKIKANK